MPGPRILALATAAAAAVTATACDGRDSPATRPDPRDDATPTTPVTPVIPLDAAPPPASLGPGPAYLGVDGVGLVRLEDGQITRVVDASIGFKAIAIDRDGVVYAAGYGGMWQLNAGPAARIDNGNTYFEHLALGPDGVVWALDHQGLHRWDGRSWTLEPAATFDDSVFRGLTVDLDGRVWVVTTERVWRLDGDHWSGLDGGFTGRDRPFFWGVATTPDGTVLVTSMGGLFAFDGAGAGPGDRDGDGWRDTGLGPRMTHVDDLTVGSGGHIAARAGVSDLILVPPGGGTRRIRLGGATTPIDHADLLAVDHLGRAWLSSDQGVTITGPDGAILHQWPPGTVAGIDGSVTAIAVVGDGPTLPTLRPPRTGTVTGRVMHRRRPVARAEVELCESPMLVFEDSPCEDAAVRYRVTAGGDGRFRIPDVVVGSYGFAVKRTERWQMVVLAPDCCTELGQADTVDVGVVSAD